MDYKIVVEETYHELETEVKKLLKKGWKLQGGVSPFTEGPNNTKFWFYQAMVKE